MKTKVRIISQKGENFHLVWENQPFNIGDEIIDIDLFENGQEGAIRICESEEDAFHCMDCKTFRKLICGPEKIGYFILPGTIHHDRVVMYLDDYTIEELHPDTIPEILESGGECEIQIHNLPPDGGGSPIPFLVDNKVLIHWKK